MPFEKRLDLSDTGVNISCALTTTASQPCFETHRRRTFRFARLPAGDVQLRCQFASRRNQNETVQRTVDFAGCVLQAMLTGVNIYKGGNPFHEQSADLVTAGGNLQ